MDLFSLAQSGSPDALSVLVRQHIPLVQALCRRFPWNEDAFQQGCMGLVRAIRNFRPDLGCQFSTYAVPVILGEIRRAGSRALGWRSRAALKKAKEYQNEMMLRTGEAPTVQQLAAHIRMDAAELAFLLEQEQGPVYDETGFLLNTFADPQSEEWLLRFCIQDVLSRMPPEESWLIRQRFIWGRSQTELARALGTTQSRLSRREKRAKEHFQAAWRECV